MFVPSNLLSVNKKGSEPTILRYRFHHRLNQRLLPIEEPKSLSSPNLMLCLGESSPSVKITEQIGINEIISGTRGLCQCIS